MLIKRYWLLSFQLQHNKLVLYASGGDNAQYVVDACMCHRHLHAPMTAHSIKMTKQAVNWPTDTCPVSIHRIVRPGHLSLRSPHNTGSRWLVKTDGEKSREKFSTRKYVTETDRYLSFCMIRLARGAHRIRLILTDVERTKTEKKKKYESPSLKSHMQNMPQQNQTSLTIW